MSISTERLQVASTAVATWVPAEDWRRKLPVLSGHGLTLRELRMSDAPALLELLTATEVAQFISPPPTTVDGFERFIAWAQQERAAGRYICYAVVPEGMDTAIGIFQIRQLEPSFGIAEWGFALGQAFWGSGAFVAGARLAIEFAFETIGVHRLEARAAVGNGRGNGALMKIGAVREGLLRRSFLRFGQYQDQVLWSLVRDDWRLRQATSVSSVH